MCSPASVHSRLGIEMPCSQTSFPSTVTIRFPETLSSAGIRSAGTGDTEGFTSAARRAVSRTFSASCASRRSRQGIRRNRLQDEVVEVDGTVRDAEQSRERSPTWKRPPAPETPDAVPASRAAAS